METSEQSSASGQAATEVRAPNTITVEPEQQQAAAESLRDQIARLTAQAEAEEAAAKAEQEAASPPRPADQIVHDFMTIVADKLGNSEALTALVSEFARTVEK